MRKNFILLSAVLVSVFLHFQADAQYINTVAGDGGFSYVGDNGPALQAEIHWPKGVALDRHRNLYIADCLNNVVRKVTPWGIITTVAGSGFGAGTGAANYQGDGGAATAAHLWNPSGICVDSNGFIYIADYSNNIVRVVDTNGKIYPFAGTGGPTGGYAGDGGVATAALLSQPAKVAMDTFGNLYIVDMGNNCIRQVSPAGVIITVAGNGSPGYSGDGGPATAAQLSNPADVAIDSTGNLYIADEENDVIRFVDMGAATIATLAGAGSAGYRGDGGSATTALFFDPTGVALDDSGNLFISDYGNNRIRAINLPTGIITTVAGDGTEGFSGDGGPATNAKIWTPQGLATDVKGGVYIADMGNNRVRYLSTPITGVKTISMPAVDISVFPNPCRGDFAIYLPQGITGQVDVAINNAIGEHVKEFSTSGNTLTDVKFDEPPGIYFIMATSANGIWNKQLVVLSGM